MILRFPIAVACIGTTTFMMSSENPDIKHHRDAVAQLLSGLMRSEMKNAKDTRTSLQQLQARNSDGPPPCIIAARCSTGFSTQTIVNQVADDADRMKAAFPTLSGSLKPRFIPVDPAN